MTPTKQERPLLGEIWRNAAPLKPTFKFLKVTAVLLTDKHGLVGKVHEGIKAHLTSFLDQLQPER